MNLVCESALEKARVDVFGLSSEINSDYVTGDETCINGFESIYVDTKVIVAEDTSENKVRRLFEVAHSNCPINKCLVGSCIKLVTHLTIDYQ